MECTSLYPTALWIQYSSRTPDIGWKASHGAERAARAASTTIAKNICTYLGTAIRLFTFTFTSPAALPFTFGHAPNSLHWMDSHRAFALQTDGIHRQTRNHTCLRMLLGWVPL